MIRGDTCTTGPIRRKLELMQTRNGLVGSNAALADRRVTAQRLFVQTHPARHVHADDIALGTRVQDRHATHIVQFERQQQAVLARAYAPDLDRLSPATAVS